MLVSLHAPRGGDDFFMHVLEMRTKHAQYALESIKQSKCQECWWQHCRNHRSRMTFFSNHHINILLFHVYLASHESRLTFSKPGRF